MQAIFPNVELVIKLQTSPMTQMSVAIVPALKIPRKTCWDGNANKRLLTSGKVNFYYEGNLRMFVVPPGAKIFRPLLAMKTRMIPERPSVKRQAK